MESGSYPHTMQTVQVREFLLIVKPESSRSRRMSRSRSLSGMAEQQTERISPKLSDRSSPPLSLSPSLPFQSASPKEAGAGGLYKIDKVESQV